MTEVEKFKMRYKNAPAFICGDFNSTPNSSVYKFFSKNYISKTTLQRMNLAHNFVDFLNYYRGEGSLSFDSGRKKNNKKNNKKNYNNNKNNNNNNNNNDNNSNNKINNLGNNNININNNNNSNIINSNNNIANNDNKGIEIDEVKTMTENFNNLNLNENQDPNIVETHSLFLKSAYLSDEENSQFITNFHNEFHGCLDYIWYEPFCVSSPVVIDCISRKKLPSISDIKS